MKLITEQLEQCRKDFEMFYAEKVMNDKGFDIREKHFCWIGFQAAWRPRLSVDEISDVIMAANNELCRPGCPYCIAQVIYRAQGGDDE